MEEKLKNIQKEYNSKMGKNNNIDSFLNIDNIIIRINRKIQELFYDFILDILVIMNKYFEYDFSFLNIIKNKNKNNTDLSE